MKINRGISSLLLLAALGIGGSAVAEEPGSELILGDSVAFSYIAAVGYEYFYTNPANFVGFPEDLGRSYHLNVVNAACPGETTGSYLSSTAPDNGCRLYRSLFPLHATYTSTQRAFASAYLKSHANVRLVTITLGANDALLLEASCASKPTPAQVAACIAAGAPALFASVAEHIATTLAEVRATGYAGPIVVTNYYSLDYADAPATELTVGLNAAISAPASAFGAVVADLFTAFEAVAAQSAFGGNTCNTGLLNPDVKTPYLCDIHPAQSGHSLIAQTITEALGTTYLY
jgi:lysophospholipase L1-like esterase